MALHVTRLKISNYRGIEALDTAVGEAGVVAKGRNAGGKTTIINAIRTALLAGDTKPDAIRIGAERAEILVEIGGMEVTRTITPKGSEVTIVDGNGMVPKKPQTFLNDLIGAGAIDPLDLMLSKPKERRSRVLEAVPATITVAELRAWAPVPDDHDVSGHALEVLRRTHAYYYDERSIANKAAKLAADESEILYEKLPPEGERFPGALTVREAEQRRSMAEQLRASLRTKRENARAAAERATATRTKIDALLVEAKDHDAIAARDRVPQGELDGAGVDVDAAVAEVTRLEEALAAAKTVVATARHRRDFLVRKAGQSLEAQEDAASCRAQAEQLAAAIAQVSAPDVSDKELAEADDAVEDAASEIALAAKRADAEAKMAAFTAARDNAQRLAKEAKRLEVIVTKLRDDAPAALLKKSDTIPGLCLVGDDVGIDGVAMGALCGAEQIRMCVEIARRLTGKTQLLVVDGLERLDPEQMDLFVREATSDGWQLIGTRVDRGEVVFEAIQPVATAQAAE